MWENDYTIVDSGVEKTMKVDNRVGIVSLVVGIVLLILVYGDYWTLGIPEWLGFFDGFWWVAWILIAILITVGIVGLWGASFGGGTIFLPMPDGRNSLILLVVLFVILLVYGWMVTDFFT